MTLYTRVSYWLTPDPRTVSVLHELIEHLAERYSGPVFTPHLSVCVGSFQTTEEAQHALTQLVVNFPAPSLAFSAVRFEEQFIRSCYIELNSHPVLSSISSQLSSQLPEAENYHLEPHISLFYGKLSEQAKVEIAVEVEKLDKFYLTQIVANATPPVHASAKDIERWYELASLPLPSPIACSRQR